MVIEGNIRYFNQQSNTK